MNIELSTLVEISKLFIPIIAIAGIWIAWQQFTANREKIKWDLFDRRFKIYNTINNSIGKSLFEAESLEIEEYLQFITACNQAQFLVPDKVYKQIKSARELMENIRKEQRKLQRYRKSDKDVKELIDNICSLEKQLENLDPSITMVFYQVLKFEKY